MGDEERTNFEVRFEGLDEIREAGNALAEFRRQASEMYFGLPEAAPGPSREIPESFIAFSEQYRAFTPENVLRQVEQEMGWAQGERRVAATGRWVGGPEYQAAVEQARASAESELRAVYARAQEDLPEVQARLAALQGAPAARPTAPVEAPRRRETVDTAGLLGEAGMTEEERTALEMMKQGYTSFAEYERAQQAPRREQRAEEEEVARRKYVAFVEAGEIDPRAARTGEAARLADEQRMFSLQRTRREEYAQRERTRERAEADAAQRYAFEGGMAEDVPWLRPAYRAERERAQEQVRREAASAQRDLLQQAQSMVPMGAAFAHEIIQGDISGALLTGSVLAQQGAQAYGTWREAQAAVAAARAGGAAAPAGAEALAAVAPVAAVAAALVAAEVVMIAAIRKGFEEGARQAGPAVGLSIATGLDLAGAHQLTQMGRIYGFDPQAALGRFFLPEQVQAVFAAQGTPLQQTATGATDWLATMDRVHERYVAIGDRTQQIAMLTILFGDQWQQVMRTMEHWEATAPTRRMMERMGMSEEDLRRVDEAQDKWRGLKDVWSRLWAEVGIGALPSIEAAANVATAAPGGIPLARIIGELLGIALVPWPIQIMGAIMGRGGDGGEDGATQPMNLGWNVGQRTEVHLTGSLRLGENVFEEVARQRGDAVYYETTRLGA